MASKEAGQEGEGVTSTIAVFLSELAYVVVMLLVMFSPISFLGVIKVFGGFMLVGFIFQMTLFVSGQREHRRLANAI